MRIKRANSNGGPGPTQSDAQGPGPRQSIRVKKTPSEVEQEILDYLAATDSYKRKRKIRFPETEYVEDYGIGYMAPFIDKYLGEFSYVKPEKRTSKDLLQYLQKFDEEAGPYGYNVGKKSYIPASRQDDPLTVYEETIHGAQAPGSFRIDKTFGKRVGKTKREFMKVAEDAFRGTPSEPWFNDLAGYNGRNFPNIEAEAKPMALKMSMQKLGVIDDYTVTDSDLDNIREWFLSNPDQMNDPFAWLFSKNVLIKPEYRSALLDYLNSF